MSDCPKCGSTVVYEGLSTVECEGQHCENNPRPWCYVDPQVIDYLKMAVKADDERLPRMGGGYFSRIKRPITYDTSGSVSKEDMDTFFEHMKKFYVIETEL